MEMTAQSEAYRFAQGLIKEATVNRAESLSFDRPETRALVQLPPEIRFLDGLRKLDLNRTDLTDISVVRELAGLTDLSLDNTQVSDLSPLAGLTALTRLSLTNTQVSDLSALAGLTALTMLMLDNTQVSDLSPLAGLSALRTLSLNNTQVSDLSPLAGLSALTALNLFATQVSDLSALAGLTALTMLMLDNTQVSDLSPLAGLTALTRLSLSITQVSDLSPLAGLSALTTLWLDGTQVSDLSPLAGLSALATLWLTITQVSDLSPLAGLTALTTLMLDGTQVSDLSPLAGLTALTTLSLSSTQVSDLSPLAGLTALTTLSLYSTQVSDLSPLAGLTALTTLMLENTQVSDLSPLAGLTALTTLSLNSTQVSDLSPLAGLTALTTLSLDGTPALDLRPLRNLGKLTESDKRLEGLSFKHTAATRADGRIAEIAEIGDNAERAKTLFAYLEGWEVPVPKDSELVPSYIWPVDGPIRSRDAAPNDVDPDQDDLREDLCRKARLLVGLIGDSNELAILKGAANHYLIQIDRPLSNIKLSLLYSAANTLRVAHEADLRAREQSLYNAQLPPKEGAALEDVVQTHALFFMGFATGHEIHARMTSGLTGVRNAQEIAAAEPIVTALEVRIFDNRPVALDQEDQAALADDLASAKGQGPSAEIGGLLLRGRIGNLLGAIGRRIYGLGTFVAKEVAAGLIGSAVVNWVVTNQVAIWTWLKLVQGAASGWFQRVLEVLQGLM
jgi:Leucine-rich repeat (LRR) protein